MRISTRVSIQWPPASAEENTDTMVLTSPGKQFVDIRVFKDSGKKYPLDFPFDWCIAGHCVNKPDHNGKQVVEFQHEIDSRYIVAKTLGESDADKFLAADQGEFVLNEAGDEIETGEMLNTDTGKIEPYVEIWRILSPHSQPGKYEKLDESADKPVPVLVLVPSGKLKGKLVRVGDWFQAFLYDDSKEGLAGVYLLRGYWDGKGWRHIVAYGDVDSVIPVDFVTAGEGGEFGGVEWKVSEIHNYQK